MAKILIKNGRVWDGEGFIDADVLVAGDKIAKIEKGITDGADLVFDVAGMIVSAGLVDIHVHMRGISCDTFGTQAEMSCFPFGVTAAADAGGGLGDEKLLDSFTLKSAVFVGVNIVNNRSDLKAIERELPRFGERVVGVKICFDETYSDARDIMPLREACEFAHSRGLRVMVHCSNSPAKMSEILDTLDAGDILTHAFHGGKNNAAEDEFAGLIMAKERGVIIDTGMAGYVHTDFGVLREAIRHGALPDTISTDITRCSAYIRGGRYGMTTCMSIMRSLGMAEEDIFRAVTATPAGAIGREEVWGSLKVGGSADIAVLDYTGEGFDMTDSRGNRIFSTKGYRCKLTVLNGEIVYRD